MFDDREMQENLKPNSRWASLFTGGSPLPRGVPFTWSEQLEGRNNRLRTKITPADGVSLDRDKRFFFSRTSIDSLLSNPNAKYLVLAFGCNRKKGDGYGKLRPFLFSVNDLDDEEPLGNVFRPHDKAVDAATPNHTLNNPLRVTKLQMNFLRRNLLLELIDQRMPPSFFKAFNEFIGFSHSRKDWEDLISPTGGPQAQTVAVVLGVDFVANDPRGQTKPMLVAFPKVPSPGNPGTVDDFEQFTDLRLKEYSMLDNGGQCCPNET